MKWMKNLISYYKNGEPGECPVCGSVSVKIWKLNHGRESINFECQNCGEVCHIDGTINEDKRKA